MKNLEKLFNKKSNNDYSNSVLNVEYLENEITFHLENKIINGLEVFRMIDEIIDYDVERYNFNFINIGLADGLVSIFLDCIVYGLIKNGKEVSWNVSFQKTEQITEIDAYITSALNNYQRQYSKIVEPLLKFIKYKQNKVENNMIYEDFITFFKKKIIKDKNFIRFNLDRNKLNEYEDLIYEEVLRIFKLHNLSKDLFIDIDDIINEVIENIKEKTDGDVILTFFINDIKEKQTKIDRKMLESCILSFQSNTIYDDVSSFYKKLYELDIDNMYLSSEYNKLKSHYEVQKEYFDYHYTKEHFLTMAAFHNRVSSRERAFGKNGGTGLPELISRIKTCDVDGGFSYVYTGDVIIYFKKGMLNPVENIISYNLSEDIGEKPNQEVYITGPNYLPGVGYNLVFPI